ncbi:MAG TPA: hypothetical protein PLV43_00405 [Aequorivita sp.]|nr:hypothetical protein [Aequorivita sp.]
MEKLTENLVSGTPNSIKYTKRLVNHDKPFFIPAPFDSTQGALVGH